MNPIKHLIVGTAGHIDHGKSALVEALTGTNPDRLEEEKRRGITIDLGFEFLHLSEVSIGFVDVPGHEKFVRNMLAGVGGFDMVVLVVAADESIKPQTREHFDICRLLGIPCGIVAITKSDLVDRDVLDLVRLEIEDFVRGSFLEGAPIVPVSARTGKGLDDLKQALHRMAQSIRGKSDSRHLRLPIDRVFAMQGFGTVVTGTLISGSLGLQDEVELYPSRKRVRVRGLQSGGEAQSRAVAGQRTAVNLSGIEREEIQRGMVIGPVSAFEPTRRFDARLTLLPSVRSLNKRSRVHFHQGTAEAIADIVLLDCDQLLPGESALAQLKLDQSVLVLPGDRFIVRQFSPVITIGAGVVLDPLARRHRTNETGFAAFLESLESGDPHKILKALAEASPHGLGIEEIVARTGWTETRVHEAAKDLVDRGELQFLGEHSTAIASRRAVTDCSAAIVKAIDEFHRSNPLLPGIPKQELKGKTGVWRAELFEVALANLARQGHILVMQDKIQRAGREIVLSPDESRSKELIEREFERAGLTVPGITAVLGSLPVEAARARKILQNLLREKVLVKISDDLIFHRSAVERLRNLLANYRRERGERLPVPVFKELTGVTRKYAIPLLEYLDRERVTRRVGDERVIL